MNRGKKTCEVLKSVRKQIAEANGIPYTPAECSFEGECAGTCPNCERERQYIEAQLCKKEEGGWQRAENYWSGGWWDCYGSLSGG